MKKSFKLIAFLMMACLMLTMLSGVAFATDGGDLDTTIPGDVSNPDDVDGGSLDDLDQDDSDDLDDVIDGGKPDDEPILPTNTTPDDDIIPEPTIEYWTISFNANGGSGSMSDQKVEKGQSASLSSCGFTAPENKTFSGWSTSADGSVAYANGASVTPASDMTLYAVWAAAPTQPDPGEGNGGNPTDPTNPSNPTDPADPADPTDPGNGGDDDPAPTEHTHSWVYKKSGASILAYCDTESTSGSAEVSAQADECQYQGESNAVKVTIKKSGSAISLHNADAFNAATGKTVSDSDIKYFKGTVALNGVPTAAGTYTAKLTVEDKTAELEYTISSSGSITPGSGTSTKYYSITYMPNGACGCPCFSQSGPAGSTKRIMCNPFSSDAVFIGWCTRPTGCGGTWYEPGECVKLTGNLTLYARWVVGEVDKDTGKVVYYHSNEHYGWTYTCGPNGVLLVSPKTGDISVLPMCIISLAGAAFAAFKSRRGK